MSNQKPWLPWMILFLLALVWGSSFILIKRSLDVYSPGEVGALRVMITWLFLLPFALKRFRNHSLKKWMLFLTVGTIGSLIPAFLFAAAQKGIDSSLAGILNSLTPLFTLLLGMAFFRTRPKWFNVAGVFIGLSGALGLVSVSGNGNFSFNMGFAILIIIAAICYAINVNTIKAFLQDVEPITITAMSFFTVGPIAAAYLFTGTSFMTTVGGNSEALKGLGYLAILSIGGTGLALMLFNTLIQLTSAVFASSVTYFIPVVAVMWGIADGEKFRAGFLIWICLVIAGVLLVNTRSLTKNRIFRFFSGILKFSR